MHLFVWVWGDGVIFEQGEERATGTTQTKGGEGGRGVSDSGGRGPAGQLGSTTYLGSPSGAPARSEPAFTSPILDARLGGLWHYRRTERREAHYLPRLEGWGVGALDRGEGLCGEATVCAPAA